MKEPHSFLHLKKWQIKFTPLQVQNIVDKILDLLIYVEEFYNIDYNLREAWLYRA